MGWLTGRPVGRPVSHPIPNPARSAAGADTNLASHVLAGTDAGEQGNTLDMVGLREHIDRLGCNQPITATRAKRSYIARQGAGIARNVANSTWTNRLQRLQRFGVAARARRINQRQVNTFSPVV